MGDKNYQIDIREVLSRKYAGGYAKQEFLQLPDRYRMIGDGAFQDNIRIERLDLSDRLQVIGRNAFRHSIALKEVRLPRSVERLGDGCFSDCPRIREAYMSRYLREVPRDAFREDRKLLKILFTKDSVLTRIGRDAFSECVSLEKILLPGTVTEVDDRAFYRCKSLKTVRFPEGLKRIGKEAFYFCAMETLELPEEVVIPKKNAPSVNGTLRQTALRVPEVTWQCSGIMVFGKKIRSLVFSTDLAIIKNINADAVIAVYPFTPQPIINEALLMASDIPVFTGVGGGLTKGHRVVNLAMYAEMQGAMGVISRMRRTIDIPIVVTVANHGTDYARRIDDGAAIFNVAAGSATAEIVAEIRAQYPDMPIMATGGPSDESILRTIDAGANAITYTPPSSAELFKHTMERYRMGLPYE